MRERRTCRFCGQTDWTEHLFKYSDRHYAHRWPCSPKWKWEVCAAWKQKCGGVKEPGKPRAREEGGE